jgi:hypothetical protein
MRHRLSDVYATPISTGWKVTPPTGRIPAMPNAQIVCTAVVLILLLIAIHIVMPIV